MERFHQAPGVQGRVVFLNDYDMMLAQELVQGIDLWINTPRRPWEACGTSGMKVLVNGGLNLSELDGWWAEAYSPEVGWAIGDGQEHGEDPAWDAKEAEALYTLLEHEVIPEFYERKKSNVPLKWLGHIRESMAQLTPKFSRHPCHPRIHRESLSACRVGLSRSCRGTMVRSVWPAPGSRTSIGIGALCVSSR